MAEPASGCNRIKIIGIVINPKAMTWDLNILRFALYELRKLAIAKQVANLANSEGCKLNPPKLNHDVAPLTFFPIIKTAINDKMESA